VFEWLIRSAWFKRRKVPAAVRQQAVDLIRERYSDFGPTLACEKFVELHGLTVSVETLRPWMIEAEIWLPRSRRARRSHQPRQRRFCVGELIQIDGCNHRWFEDRGPACMLLVYVDDATSSIMELHFVESESTFDYFEATRRYITRHGKPMALYSDRHSVFHIAEKPRSGRGEGLSQFGRALGEINVDIICANSAEAKGRVERAHLTLQETRRITNNLTVNYKRGVYLIEDSKQTRRLRGATATVHERADGSVVIKCGDATLGYRVHQKETARISQGTIVDNKHLGAAFAFIAEQQKQRDAEKLANPKVSLRAKKRIRAAAQAG
jgi:hypothetical protein